MYCNFEEYEPGHVRCQRCGRSLSGSTEQRIICRGENMGCCGKRNPPTWDKHGTKVRVKYIGDVSRPLIKIAGVKTGAVYGFKNVVQDEFCLYEDDALAEPDRFEILRPC